MVTKDFTGKAFVVFDSQDDTQQLIWKFQRSWIRRIFNFIVLKILKIKNYFQDTWWWEGQRIDLERAAEPTNVYWENMSVTFSSRFKYSWLTYFTSFILLLIVFLINFGLSFSRNLLANEISNVNGDSSKLYNAINSLISILSSIIIAINNALLTLVIRSISKLERHETYTKYNVSVSIKLTFSMFINSGMIPMLIHYFKDNWFTCGGLAFDIFLIMITINFISPLTKLFDVSIFWKKMLIFIHK